MLPRSRLGAAVATALTALIIGTLADAPPALAGPPRAKDRKDLSAYRGLGTWVDAYDFSREKNPGKTPGTQWTAVDAMAKAGVKTLYIQASKADDDTPNLLLSQDLLAKFLYRAHQDNLRVVGWYLPKLTGPTSDWNHLKAMVDFRANGQGFDSIGLDIESREEKDVDARNSRLINLSHKVRNYIGNRMPLSAIVLPPVVTDIINTAYWPNFPWLKLKYTYDVWQPMGYFTNRTQQSGYRDPYRYTADNISLLRKDLHSQTAPIHAVGGIGDRTSTPDLRRFISGLQAGKSLGGSIYDWATTNSGAWPTLRGVPH